MVTGPEKSRDFQGIKEALQLNRVPSVVLAPEEFPQRIPDFVLADGHGAVVDTTAGVLYADRALKAVQVGALGLPVQQNTAR